jgi:hypothetical protein
VAVADLQVIPAGSFPHLVEVHGGRRNDMAVGNPRGRVGVNRVVFCLNTRLTVIAA